MSICLRCGVAFSCALLGEQDGPCWCTALPAVLPVPASDGAASCFCPGCLKMAIDAQKSSEPAPPHD